VNPGQHHPYEPMSVMLHSFSMPLKNYISVYPMHHVTWPGVDCDMHGLLAVDEHDRKCCCLLLLCHHCCSHLPHGFYEDELLGESSRQGGLLTP